MATTVMKRQTNRTVVNTATVDESAMRPINKSKAVATSVLPLNPERMQMGIEEMEEMEEGGSRVGSVGRSLDSLRLNHLAVAHWHAQS
jgi:hypothetical protein